mmetsp:Transcript_9431/g.35040  ORF Transcript_9431/g.35040 Transcript_9431/m.35040 type:complete len:115 (-) Transcript_9431:1816-2160(-)
MTSISHIPDAVVNFLQNPPLSYTYSLSIQNDASSQKSPTIVVSFSKPTASLPIPQTVTYMYLKYKQKNDTHEFYCRFEGEKLWRKVKKGEFKEEWVDLVVRMRERVAGREDRRN